MGQDFVEKTQIPQSTGVLPLPSSHDQDQYAVDHDSTANWLNSLIDELPQDGTCLLSLLNKNQNLLMGDFAVNKPTTSDDSLAIDNNNQTSSLISSPNPPCDSPVTNTTNPNGGTENNLTSYGEPAASSRCNCKNGKGWHCKNQAESGTKRCRKHYNAKSIYNRIAKKAKIEASQCYSVKAKFGENPPVKFPITSTTKVEDIKREVGELLKLEEGSFKMSYIDEDGDEIMMETKSNLKEALRIAKLSKRHFVALDIARYGN